jgi:Undecaprenyl-phosphate galactose phosphotransferase WbaP
MTTLTRPRFAPSLMQTPTAKSEAGWSSYRPVTCAVVLFAADCLAMAATVIIVSWCTALFWPRLDVLLPSGSMSGRLGLVALFAAMLFYFAVKGRYREPIPFWTETRMVVCTSLWAIGGEVVFGLQTSDVPSRPTSIILLALPLLVLPILATAANRLAKRTLSSAGLWTLPVVVIGDNQGTVETALKTDRSLGYRFVSRVDPDAVLAAPAGSSRLWPILNRYRARRLMIVVEGDRQRQLIECALRERVPFALVPPDGFPAFPFEPSSFFSHDTMLLSFRDGLSRPFARIAKVAFDVSVAAMLLVITSPLFLILAIINRLDGTPTLFAHQRVGAHGESFYCLKFRTMVVDADQVLAEALARDPDLAAEWATTRKLVNDPRVTRVGRFLRKTSLDELPQLINVLRLEMSLVGPRPIVESEIQFYGEDIAQYYAIRPGLTGLWQVSGRSSISYARRVQLDVWYVNNWTIWHDIVVLLKTIPAVLGRQGAC